jgi:hypothetical protein
MKTTTLAEIILSAQSAARKAFEARTALARKTLALEEFNTAGFDPADFETWENAFNAQLEMLTHFSKQDSPATIAAKKAAAMAK